MARRLRDPLRLCCADGCRWNGASVLLRARGVRFRVILCDVHEAQLLGKAGPPEKMPPRSPLDAMTPRQADIAAGFLAPPARSSVRPLPPLEDVLAP